MVSITSFVADHILDNKVPYIVVVGLVVLGAMGGAYGQQWLDSRINHQIDIRLADLQADVGDIKLILLHQQMRDLKMSLCRTPGDVGLIEQIENLQADHRKQTKTKNHPGYRYELPTCEALGVAGVDDEPQPEALAAN